MIKNKQINIGGGLGGMKVFSLYKSLFKETSEQLSLTDKLKKENIEAEVELATSIDKKFR